MDKKINTLAELMNVFSGVETERLLEALCGYAADAEEHGLERYPFPKTDREWIHSLQDSYLQAEETCGGDINLFTVFRYGINDYLASCARENREMYHLVEAYEDTDAYRG